MRLKVSPVGSVTQATSKSTGVTIDTMAGAITMNNASLASATSVGFTVTCASVDADDTVNLCLASGGTATSYLYGIDAVANGSFKVHVRNMSGGALGEALVFNYSIIKNMA